MSDNGLNKFYENAIQDVYPHVLHFEDVNVEQLLINNKFIALFNGNGIPLNYRFAYTELYNNSDDDNDGVYVNFENIYNEFLTTVTCSAIKDELSNASSSKLTIFTDNLDISSNTNPNNNSNNNTTYINTLSSEKIFSCNSTTATKLSALQSNIITKDMCNVNYLSSCYDTIFSSICSSYNYMMNLNDEHDFRFILDDSNKTSHTININAKIISHVLILAVCNVHSIRKKSTNTCINNIKLMVNTDVTNAIAIDEIQNVGHKYYSNWETGHDNEHYEYGYSIRNIFMFGVYKIPNGSKLLTAKLTATNVDSLQDCKIIICNAEPFEVVNLKIDNLIY